MFYDERIELEKGKVCRNRLIIATVGKKDTVCQT
jgi:hypothetical protein